LLDLSFLVLLMSMMSEETRVKYWGSCFNPFKYVIYHKEISMRIYVL